MFMCGIRNIIVSPWWIIFSHFIPHSFKCVLFVSFKTEPEIKSNTLFTCKYVLLMRKPAQTSFILIYSRSFSQNLSAILRWWYGAVAVVAAVDSAYTELFQTQIWNVCVCVMCMYGFCCRLICLFEFLQPIFFKHL